jgi:hypothetical protein
MSRSWSRRALLQAVGAAPVLAPFLPRLEAEAQTVGAPKRVCFIHTPNGLLRQELVPNGTTFKRILEPCTKHQRDILFLDGVHMTSYNQASPRPPNDHPPPLGHILTGSDTVDPKDGKAPSASSSWFASDVSIDQYLGRRIAEKTPLAFPSLTLGVRVGGYGWHISHTGYRKPVAPDNDWEAVRARLMRAGAGGAGDAAFERMKRERKSARDAVRAELGALLTKVSADDRRKIEAHLEVIGELEKREQSGATGAGSRGTCAAFKPRDHRDPAAEARDAGGARFVRDGKEQMDNIALAFACDATRVALLQWDICASERKFTWAGVEEGHHHLSHQSPNGKVYEGLTRIGRWYAEQFVYLIERLKAIPEGNGTVFDNTLLVWMSEHSSSSGDHGRNNLPCILAGRLGGRIAPGRVLKLNRAHNDVFITIAQAMGFSDVTTFGKKSVCRGPISELG